uniref:Uncharacterized protein n=1 Tax=Romanomermis culicivorax TaxID=13658 RepID=A0A915HPI9_ROMCU
MEKGWMWVHTNMISDFRETVISLTRKEQRFVALVTYYSLVVMFAAIHYSMVDYLFIQMQKVEQLLIKNATQFQFGLNYLVAQQSL